MSDGAEVKRSGDSMHGPDALPLVRLKRLAHAPNIAIATLWADLLTQEGFDAVV